MNDYNPNDLFLCIDQGGHASRVLVFNQHGKLVSRASQDIEAQHTAEGFIEYHADEVLNSIRTPLRSVLEELGPKQHDIRAAGLATQRSNIVCWDSITGQALSPIISWQDRRGAAQLSSLKSHAKQIQSTTGLFLSPHYGASKFRWCLDHLPAVQTALAEQRLSYGPMASYLIHHLVQAHPHITDPVNASRTQLLNLQTLDWDAGLLELFDVPREPLPECVPSLYPYGQLVEAPEIPLRLVSGDQATAMYAYGRLQPDTAYLNIGTGAFVSRPSGQARIYGRRLLTSLIWHQPGNTEYVLEGTVNGAGSALEWFAEEYDIPNLLQELPHWLSEGISTEALFLNGISGLGAPFWVADFPSRFEGDASLKARAIAVVESIVYLLQASLDEMQKLASPPEQIQITGGLAHLDGLCQRIADLSDLPVYRPLQCEATGRGSAYLLAGSPSDWPEDNPGEWFEPVDNPLFKQAYRQWMDLMLQTLRAPSP
jgi:glycerol kinase